MTIELSTPLAREPAAITSTIVTRDTDSPVATTSVDFPPAFEFNERFHPARCQLRQEQERACPPESRIGTVQAQSLAGPAEGGVYLTEDFRVVVFADAANGLIAVKATGVVTLNERGGFTITFSGLPNLPVRETKLEFEGGERGMLRNPRTCGTYELVARLIAHSGEQAQTTVPLTIDGCLPAPDATVTRTGRHRFTVRWSAPGAEATTVRLQRRFGVDWVTVHSRRTTATSWRFSARRPGRYRLRLRSAAGDRRSPDRILAFTASSRAR